MGTISTTKDMAMNIIWKYPLEIVEEQSLMMPEGSEILTAQIQQKVLCLWALVYSTRPQQLRKIEIIGTGNYIDENVKRKYISTVQMADGKLIFHVFEKLS